MPSPNGYFDCLSGEATSRNSFENRIEHDLESPPWDFFSANQYGFVVNVGTSATGPFTAAGLSDDNTDPCPLGPDNRLTVSEASGSASETFAHIAQHNGAALVAGTSYWVEWILEDEAGDEVDRFVCGPYVTETIPTLFCTPINITETSATLRAVSSSGAFNRSACSQDSYTIEYGTTAGGPWDTTIGPTLITGTFVSEDVTGLTPDTEYFYRVTVTNPDTGTVVVTNCTFSTEAEVVAPTAECAPAFSITDTSATLNGMVNDAPTDHTIQFRWGSATGVYTNTDFNSNGTNVTGQNVIDPVTGLTPSTQYFYVVEVLDATDAVVATSPECTFTTEEASIPLTAYCSTASAVTSTTATFNGSADGVPTDHTVRISWGPDGVRRGTNGPGTAGTNTTGQTISLSVTNLLPNTEYFFTTEILDAGGTIVAISTECSVTTPGTPAARCRPAYSITETSATLSGFADNAPTDSNVRFRWGSATGVYGNTDVVGTGTNVVGQSVSDPITGLTANTQYFYVVEIVDGNIGGPVIAASPECTFTTQADISAECAPATEVTDTTATFNGSANNVPSDHTVRISWGPDGVRRGTNGPGTAGTNTTGQTISLSVNNLLPNTEYFFTVEVLNASGTIVLFSTECSVTTNAAADYFTCDGFDRISRHSFGAKVSHDATSSPWESAGGYTWQTNIATSAAGPFTPAPVLSSHFNTCTPKPNPGDATSGDASGSNFQIGANDGSIMPDTDYWVEHILYEPPILGGGEVSRRVCGPVHTEPLPTVACLIPSAGTTATMTSATLRYGVASGDISTEDSCFMDQVTWQYGPVGSMVAQPKTDVEQTPTLEVSNLNPRTDYEYQATWEDANNNVIVIGPTCTFRTDGEATIAKCAPATFITDTSAILNGSVDYAPVNGLIRISWGEATGTYRTNGGYYSGKYTIGQHTSLNVYGLKPETTYFYVVEVFDEDGDVLATSSECSFTTIAAGGSDPLCKNCSKGICRCIQIYSDGTSLGGSGAEADPYVFEKPPVNCVKDGYGKQVAADADKCITLYPYVSILGSGRDGVPAPFNYTTDANGNIDVDAGIDAPFTSFKISDHAGTSLTMTDGSTIKIESDGQSVDEVNDVTKFNAAGDTLVVPILKNLQRKQENFNIGFSTVGGTARVVDDFMLVRDKSTRYVIQFDVTFEIDDIEANDIAFDFADERYHFYVHLGIVSDNNNNSGAYRMGYGQWSPSIGNGYASFTFKHMQVMEDASDTDYFIINIDTFEAQGGQSLHPKTTATTSVSWI